MGCNVYAIRGNDITYLFQFHMSVLQLMCLKKHSLNISDLAWSSDSLELMTGAYDNSVKLWSVETGKMNQSFETEGFVQCVGYCMQSKHVSYDLAYLTCITCRL